MGIKDHRDEMVALREAGKTYREIGELFGVSLQYVFRIISESDKGKDSVRVIVRKGSLDIEKIAYEGIYNLFVSDCKMTVTKFARIALGIQMVNPSQRELIRRFIFNYSDARLSVRNISNICRYIGEPFERVFEVRKKKYEVSNEIRQGAWVRKPDGSCICGVCGKDARDNVLTEFCPRCGAQMNDGVTE